MSKDVKDWEKEVFRGILQLLSLTDRYTIKISTEEDYSSVQVHNFSF